MPNPDPYLFAGLLVAAAIGLAGAMTVLPEILGRMLRVRRPNPVKNQSYECGITPVGGARVRFSIKFYVVAMLFILFDIEAIFLYPWAVVHRWLGWFGFGEMAVFVLILVVGYVYVWKRGAFKWE
jgi:NADH-quinone oxidoreductase subunit A